MDASLDWPWEGGGGFGCCTKTLSLGDQGYDNATNRYVAREEDVQERD